VRPRGYIDGVIGGDLVGWVVDEDEPGARVSVLAWIDGRPLAGVRATDFREDLVRAGVGDGYHGFRFELHDPLDPGDHAVAVQASGSDDLVPLADDWVVHGPDDTPRRDVSLREGRTGEAVAGRTPPPAARTEARALVGSGGWLYAVADRGFGRLRGTDRPTHADLDARVAQIEQFHSLAGDVGAVPLAAIVPDKLFVYPDHRPDGLELDPDGRVAAHVTRRLRDSGTVELLDLLPVLRDARRHGRLFPRTGDQLTWVGAFHAARALAKALTGRVPGIAPIDVDALDLGELQPVTGALDDRPLAIWADGEAVGITGMTPGPAPDSEPALGARWQRQAAEVAPGRWQRRGARHLPSALVVHNGCGSRIAQVLAEHFSACEVVESEGGVMDTARVRAARPDVLVVLVSDAAFSALPS
jgi:hypothetical protein